MAYRNQQQFIDALEKAGELVRIKAYVDPKLEMAEITDRMSKRPGGGKAILFENSGYGFPVLMNAYGSERRMCMALGVNHLTAWRMLFTKAKLQLCDEGLNFVFCQIQRIAVRTNGDDTNSRTVEPGVQPIFLCLGFTHRSNV